MATFADDNYVGVNGTLLSNHTSPLDGTTWARVGNQIGTETIQSNALSPTAVSGQGSTYKNSGVPSTPHQIATERVVIHTAISTIHGPTLRTQAVGDNYYYLQTTLTVASLRKRVNNVGFNFTDLTMAAPLTAGQYDLVLMIVGGTISTVSGQMIRISDGFYLQPDGTFAVTAADFSSYVDTNALTAAGGVGIRNGSVSGTTTTGLQSLRITAIDFNIPATGVAISGAINSTAGFASQPVFLTLTPSGLCAGDVITPHASAGTVTFTPATVTLDTDHQVLSFTVNAAAAGAFDITLTDTLGLTMPAAYPFEALDAVLIYPYNDDNCYHNDAWFEDGTSGIVANSNWAYVKMGYTGTGCSVTVDVSPLVAEGVAPGDYPFLYWETDDGVLQNHQLTSSDTVVTLSSALAAGSHTLWLFYYMPDYNPTYNLWIYGAAGYWLKINNFVLNAGAATVAPFNEIAIRPNVMWTICDSMGNLRGIDPLANMYLDIAAQLNAECVGRNFSATGINKDGTAPNATIFWPLHDSINSILVDGLIPDPPDYCFFNEGTNDTTATAAQVTAWITAFRAAAGPLCWIFVCIPFGQHNVINQSNIVTIIKAGVSAYQAANVADLRVACIDLGARYAFGLSRNSVPSIVSADSTHLRQNAMGLYASAVGGASRDAVAAIATVGSHAGSFNIF